MSDDSASGAGALPDLTLFFPRAVAVAGAECSFFREGAALATLTLVPDRAAIELRDSAGVAQSIAVADGFFTRPVSLRIAAQGKGAALHLLARAPIASPLLAPLLGADEVRAPPNVAIDRVACGVDARPALPRGFNPKRDNRQAGAVDHVDKLSGIRGWVTDLDRPESPHEVIVTCDGETLARRIAAEPRPAAAGGVGSPPPGGFTVGWADLDAELLRTVAARAPYAPLRLCVPALDRAIENVHRQISARTAWSLAQRAAPPAPPPPASVPPPRPAMPVIAPARISAVVPNYNYARYLPERLASLFAQDIGEIEVIVIDDFSRDGSVGVVIEQARAAGRPVELFCNPRNSGGVMPQWRRASLLARGEMLLIAEADDVAEPTLMSQLAGLLEAHPDMAFAFSDCMQIDAEGAITRADFQAYYAATGDDGLAADLVMPARDFLRRFLTPRNLVINASAVLWRAAALRETFARLGDTADRFRCAGDWRVYVEACLGGGSIGYLRAPLNRFRRHDDSVTGQLDKDAHLAEIAEIHRILLAQDDGDPRTDALLAAHRDELREIWGLRRAMI